MIDQAQRPRASIPKLPNASAEDPYARSLDCEFKPALGLVYSPAFRGSFSRQNDPNRNPSPPISSTRAARSLRIPKDDPPSQAA
jgi:hypothetical protein